MPSTGVELAARIERAECRLLLDACARARQRVGEGRAVGALILARLTDAARHGCDVAVVTTQPGSTSQQNMQRLGFELLYARAILVRNTAG